MRATRPGASWIGGSNLVLAPVYGPPYVRDLDGTRRRGTLEDLENFIKLVCRLPALNHSGGIICEPQDVPIPKRHLEIFRAHVRHSDKPFMGAVNAPERAMDCVEMARIVFGLANAGEAHGPDLARQRQLPAGLGRDHARRG